VVDLATGKDFIYDGFYTLKVVAVTDSPANEPRWFSDDEIVKYNNMNQYAHQSINAKKMLAKRMLCSRWWQECPYRIWFGQVKIFVNNASFEEM